MNPLVKKYGTESRWVTWRLEERKGKKTKLPYQITGKLASSTDPTTWSTYEEVTAKFKNVGITFHDEMILAVDIDHCLNADGKIVHAMRKEIIELIKAADTYTEISPSGTGLHLYLALSSPLALETNRHDNFECYTSGRYFTVTQNSFKAEKPVRTITPDEALGILKIIQYPWKTENTAPSTVSPAVSRTNPPHSLGRSPDDSKILERMFAASNGDEIKKLYNGDRSKYLDDASRADAAFLSHLAFWTAKDASRMNSLWLSSPLGARKKTQQRSDYRTRSISAAIERCTEVYDFTLKGSSEVSIDDLALLYVLKGKIKSYYKNTENITRVIQRHPDFAGTFRFDSYRSIIERRVNGVWRDLEDRDAVEIQTQISVLFSDFAHVGKEMVYDAIVKVAYDNQIDSGRDYILSLKWDGKARLDTWLHQVYGTPSDEYHRTVGGNWLKGLVKRIIIPGCKFDYVLVLEGKQGIKKSTSLGALAGILGHVETTISTEQKDFFLLMQGNAIIEFSEGEVLSRTEVKQLKSVISTPVDKYRAPYGRATMAHPRRCVFAMTTNQSEYLKDETGNRRWLPVAVTGTANIEWLEENRDQLLAEAYVRVIGKDETVHEFPEDELEAAQTERRIKDPNIDVIINWYWNQTPSRRLEGMSITDIYIEALHSGFMTKPISRNDEMSIGDVLRTWLRLEPRQTMLNGQRARRYFATPATDKLAPELTPSPITVSF